jgi:hypothetical protein
MMRRYYIVIFLMFSGLDPLSLLSGGVISPGGVDSAATFVFGILLPLSFRGVERADSGYLKTAIKLVLFTVFVRFVLDFGVDPAIAKGPWRTFLLVGGFYSVYFVFRKHLHPDILPIVFRFFVGVASFVSLINIMQVVLPGWALLGGARSFSLTGADVADTFVRFQTTYYHFATLAIVLLVYLLVQPQCTPARRVWYIALVVLNFVTVFINGYRANMYVLVSTILVFGALSFHRSQSKSKLWLLVATLPLMYFVYQYTVVRGSETTTIEGDNTSIEYRLLEAGLGIEKMESAGAWVFGVGYADGFINPFAPEPGQETYFLHNGYLSIVYNYGIVGSIVWLFLVYMVLRFIARNFRQHRRDDLYVIISAHLIGQLIQNVSSGIFNREPSATFCFLFAFSVLEISTTTDTVAHAQQTSLATRS